MEEIAGWVAPIATAVAAMMTAANLGPRITGWGFVVFLVGSIAWSTVAIATGQTNLLLANGFLTLVNLIGVWRWLGRRARFDKGAQAAEQESRTAAAASLFPVSSIVDGAVKGRDDAVVAHIVDAMVRCDDGRISYLMVREGGAAGIGERLHALDWSAVRRCDDGFTTALDREAIVALPQSEETRWPAAAPAVATS
jgi:hypothetical protein